MANELLSNIQFIKQKPSVAEHVSQLISRKFGIHKDLFERSLFVKNVQKLGLQIFSFEFFFHYSI